MLTEGKVEMRGKSDRPANAGFSIIIVKVALDIPVKECSYYEERAFLFRFLLVPLMGNLIKNQKERDEESKGTGKGTIRNAKRNQKERRKTSKGTKRNH